VSESWDDKFDLLAITRSTLHNEDYWRFLVRDVWRIDQRPIRVADFGCGYGWIGREMEGVDGHDGVGACFWKPGLGEIADDEPRLSGQPGQRRPAHGVADCHGGEVHSHQRNICFAREPKPGTAAAAPQVDKRLSW